MFKNSIKIIDVRKWSSFIDNIYFDLLIITIIIKSTNENYILNIININIRCAQKTCMSNRKYKCIKV